MRAFARRIEVPCTIDIAHTQDECHAHVDLQGVEVGPGDAVRVHDAPTRIDYGQRLHCERRATVEHAGWLAQLWTRFSARFELTLLYEVSFSSGRLHPASARPLSRKSP